MTHVVDRLRFEIRCSDEEQAFHVRRNVAASLTQLTIEVIDQVCSAHVRDDEWVRIDRLEVDLGYLNQHAIERDFAAAFRERLEQELRRKLPPRSPREATPSRARLRFELFCHVMLKGVLPWWAPAEALNLDSLAQELAVIARESLRAFLLRHAADSTLWRRLALQLGDAGREAVIALHEPLSVAQRSLVPCVEAACAAAPPSAGVDLSLMTQTKIAIARRLLLMHEPQVVQQARATIERIVAQTMGEDVTDVRAEDAVQSATVAARAAERRGEDEAARPFIARAADAATPGADRAREDSARTARPPGEQIDERYLVRDAGLALLAPFFAKFFDACGLLDGPRWRGKDARYAAAHLLKYLCAGTVGHAEHDLTLEKLCCGVALDEPIPRDVELRDDQLAEAEELLTSVIEHWTALKNTSHEGLRDAFLRRDGIVTRKDDDWLLRVERKTLDVLIDGMPWGYSTIAAPWNDYVIHVEW